jgi:hypothetical protein
MLENLYLTHPTDPDPGHAKTRAIALVCSRLKKVLNLTTRLRLGFSLATTALVKPRVSAPGGWRM